MKTIILSSALLVMLFTYSSCSNSSNKDSVEQAKDINEEKDSSDAVMAMDEDDANFMVDAANASMMEVEMGNIAQKKSSDRHVIDYATMMVNDHTKANNELKALAAMKNVTLPSAVSEDMQKHMNDMREKQVKDFDKDYIDMMVNDHKDVIGKFEKTAEKGKDADLRAWASTTLMTLRMHLDSAQYIQKLIKDRK
jgi:putative membrane protein